mmetsp:Transcript_32361/g.97316  ORF Transcript_32361/g.97316 Transcript_32361/m.97316 type:complete len:83 (-) Transcript_32361:46-294(-)
MSSLPSLEELLLTPGNAHKVVPIANAALAALIFVLLASAYKWSAIAIHLYAMVGLALGLLGSLNFVAATLRAEDAAAAAKGD